MAIDWITPGSPRTITVNGEAVIVRSMAYKERRAFNEAILNAKIDSFYDVIAEQVIAFPNLPDHLKSLPVREALEYVPTDQLSLLLQALQHGLTDVQAKNSPSSPRSVSGDTTRTAETTRSTDNGTASTGENGSGSNGRGKKKRGS